MKITRLNHTRNGSCYLVQSSDVSVLIDPSLDLYSLLKSHGFHLSTTSFDLLERSHLKSTPFQLETFDFEMIDFKHLDAILISNYESMLALPLITKYTQFTGRIFATLPTIGAGRQFIEEFIIDHIDLTTPKVPHCHHDLHNKCNTKNTFEFYTMKDVEDCFRIIEPMSFNETCELYNRVRFFPASSGYSLGACNWILYFGNHKMAFLGKSSLVEGHYPKPLDSSSLENVDTLVLSHVASKSCASYEFQVANLFSIIEKTFSVRGSVLLPAFCIGISFDLIERIAQHFPTNVIYVLSPRAKNAAGYANISGEWMNNQRLKNVYLPEEPLGLSKLVSSGQLRYFDSVNDQQFQRDFKHPSIIFASHPFLRGGDAVFFMKSWRDSKSNAVILLEPDTIDNDEHLIKMLSCYRPITMKVFSCPIDLRLRTDQVANILQTCKARNLLLVEEDYQMLQEEAESKFSCTLMKPHESSKISSCDVFERGFISSKLGLQSKEGNSVVGSLNLKNGRYRIDVSNDRASLWESTKKNVALNSLDDFIKVLQQNGYRDSIKRDSDSVHCGSLNAKVFFSEADGWKIETSNDYSLETIKKLIFGDCEC